MNALPTSATFSRLLVGFASESGNARALAQRLGADLQPHAPQVLPFNDIEVASLGHGDVLLAISSSFGDGEPPANGEQFFETLRQTPTLAGLRYAVFGLGDTGYPSFCGFTKALDAALSERQAQPHRIGRSGTDFCRCGLRLCSTRRRATASAAPPGLAERHRREDDPAAGPLRSQP